MTASSSSALAARPSLCARSGSSARSCRPIAPHQAPEDAVGIAPDQHVVAVGAGIGVARRDAGKGAAGPFAHRAEGIVFRQQALHAVEHALVQRHVDELPFAAVHLPVPERHQNADHAMQRRQGVTDGNPHADRHPPRLPGQVAEPAPWPRRGCRIPACRASGPVCPYPDMRSMTSPGLSSCSCSQPMPHSSSLPGLKFSTTTSASAASRLTAAWPSALRRSDRQGALVAGLHLPPDRGSVPEKPPFPERIAGSLGLDLDDVGTEIRQGLGGRTGRR